MDYMLHCALRYYRGVTAKGRLASTALVYLGTFQVMFMEASHDLAQREIF